MKAKLTKINFKKKLATFLCLAMLISNVNTNTLKAYASEEVTEIQAVSNENSDLEITSEVTDETTESTEEVSEEIVSTENEIIAIEEMVDIATTVLPIQQFMTVEPAAALTLRGNGWFESAYVNWDHDGTYESYNVYYKTASADDTTYKKIDTQLVRPDTKNGGYRADVLGLPGGVTYTIKVVPVLASAEVTASAKTMNVTPKSYDRTGYAFSSDSPNGTTTGGYLADGSVNPEASIIYVTHSNMNNDFVVEGKTYTGGIGKLFNSGVSANTRYTKPIIVRFVGQVGDVVIKDGTLNEITGREAFTVPANLDSTNALYVKGGQNITFEGVGDDAILEGWGITLRDTKNIVVRNLHFRYYLEDAVSINGGTNNSTEVGKANNTWITNNTFNIGINAYKAGLATDSDKQYGDGATDTTNGANYFTISYNHYDETHKNQLDGSDDDNAPVHYGTYHHNYYDNTASRNPRVRGGSVHVYNNYYTGVTGYGVGAAVGASVLVQNNYFENMQKPMIIATLGNGITSMSGTVASIKQNGNEFVNISKWDSEVDASINTPWDTTLDNLTYTMDTALVAKEKVIEFAGVQKYNALATAPDAITDLKVSINDSEKYALTWGADSNASSYEVFSSTDGTNFTSLGTTVNNYYTTTNSATADSTMYFKVVASNSVGSSDDSNIASITYSSPNAPTELTTSVNKDDLTIGWTASTTPNSTYKVVVTGPNSYNQTFTTSETTKTISDLANGTYSISVYAINGKLESTALTGTKDIAYYAINSITPTEIVNLPYTGSASQNVSVTGVNLTSGEVFLSEDGGTTKVSPTNQTNTDASFELNIGQNDTTSPVTHEFFAYVNNTKSNYSVKYVVETKPSVTEINPVNTTVSYLGNDVTVTVTGTKLTASNISLSKDNGETSIISPVINSDGTTATFSFTIAPNNLPAVRNEEYKVFLNGEATTLTSTFTVSGAPYFEFVTPETKNIAQTGSIGEQIVITGANLVASDIVLNYYDINNVYQTLKNPTINAEKTTATFTVDIPANETYNERTYIYTPAGAIATGNGYNQSAKFIVAGMPRPTVESITPETLEVAYTGGNQTVTVAGANLTTNNITLVNGATVLTPVISNNGATATFTVILPESTTYNANSVVYTVKVDGSEVGKTATFNIAGMPRPTVESIDPVTKDVEYTGGNQTVTVTGANLTTNNITLVNGATVLTPVISNNGTTATFTVALPPSTTYNASSVVYTVKLDNVAIEKTATFNIAGRPRPTVESIDPVTNEVEYTGGNQTVVVTGTNLTTTNITLVNGETVLVPVITNNGTTATFTVELTASTTYDASEVVYGVKLDGVATETTVTFNIAGKPRPTVESVNPTSSETSATGGNRTVTVTGANLTTSNITLVNGTTIVKPTSVSEDGTTALFTVSVVKNTTTSPVERKFVVCLDAEETEFSSVFVVAGRTITTDDNNNSSNSGNTINKKPIVTTPSDKTETTTDKNTTTPSTVTEGALTVTDVAKDSGLEITKTEVSDTAKETVVSYNEKNEQLLDSTASKITTDNNSSKLNDSIKLYYDLGKVTLTSDEQGDLVCVNIEADGNINYLGGIYDETSNKFFVETKNVNGDFAVILADPSLYNQVTLQINSTDYNANKSTGSMEVAPKIKNDTTFVPIRLVLESLGAEVDFDAESKTAIISLDGEDVNLQVGTPTEDAPAPFIENGRMLVPLRVIAESFGANVIWEPTTKSIQITK